MKTAAFLTQNCSGSAAMQMNTQTIERVVITGTGYVTPLGNSPDAVYAAMLQGKSASKLIRSFDTNGFRTKSACPVELPESSGQESLQKIKATERSLAMTLCAVDYALHDSKRELAQKEPVPVIIGTGLGSAAGFADIYRRIFSPPHRGPRPTAIPRNMLNMLSAQVAIKYGLRGPNWVTGSACASSATAIVSAARMIASGEYNCAVCGGVEAMLEPCAFSAWDRLGVMVPQDDSGIPSVARPFDANRQGFLLGEGAGILLLESYSSAKARNAHIYAELLGWGESSDAFSLVQPSAAGQTAAITRALQHSGVTPPEIAFIDAQGTGTQIGDTAENDALCQCFGKELSAIPLSVPKAAFGHCIGASAAIELIQAVYAWNTGEIPPHPTIKNPDPTMKVQPVLDHPRKINGRAFIKNSFGFGGTNVVMVIGNRNK